MLGDEGRVHGFDRLGPLLQHRVVIHGRVRLHHDPGRLLGMIDRIADRLLGGIGEMLRISGIGAEARLGPDQHIAEDVVSPIGE